MDPHYVSKKLLTLHSRQCVLRGAGESTFEQDLQERGDKQVWNGNSELGQGILEPHVLSS